MADPLLEVADLRTYVHADGGTVRAVDGVSFRIERGETVCLVGESGSGKSVTCESITGIVPRPPAEIVGGSVTFDGVDLTAASPGQLRAIRGDRIAHVFQNPQHTLDPVYTVGDQLVEAIELSRDAADARVRAVELLREVGIPNPAVRIDEYPHQFSGGMQQRVAVAVALAADPDLVIADEPTTSVDVTVQARLIELLDDLTSGGTAVLWVTHDLRVAATVADRMLVMFGGTLVERGPTDAVFERPAHPYTQALFESYRGRAGGGGGTARREIPADGCRFRAACPHAVEDCAGDRPEFWAVGDDRPRTADGDGHAAACVHYGPDRDPAAVLADARDAGPTAGGGGGD